MDNEKKPITNKDEEKEKIRKRYQNATTEGLEVIPAKPKVDFYEDTRILRVVVYVRVSSDKAAQTSSLEMQTKYYSDMVERHPSWILIKIYAEACDIIEPTRKSLINQGFQRVGQLFENHYITQPGLIPLT